MDRAPLLDARALANGYYPLLFNGDHSHPRHDHRSQCVVIYPETSHVDRDGMLSSSFFPTSICTSIQYACSCTKAARGDCTMHRQITISKTRRSSFTPIVILNVHIYEGLLHRFSFLLFGMPSRATSSLVQKERRWENKFSCVSPRADVLVFFSIRFFASFISSLSVLSSAFL